MESPLENPSQRVNRKRLSPDSGYDDSETTQPLSVASTLEQATNSDSNDVFDDFSVLPESSSSSRQKKGSCKRGKANRGQLSTRPTKQNIAGPKELKMDLSKVQDKDAFAGKLQKIAKTYYDQNKLLHQDFSEAREKVNKWWDVMEDLELESDATTKAVIQKLKERYDRRCQSGWTKKKEVEFIEAQEKLAKTEDHSKMLQNKIDAKNDGQIKPVNDTTSQAITELKKALSEEQNKTTALSATIQKLSEENNTLIAAKQSLETEKTEFIAIINAKNGQIEQDNDTTSQTIIDLKNALSEEKDKTAAFSATIQKFSEENNTLVAAKISLEKEKTEFIAKLEALSRSNSNLDEINAVVIKVNCLLEKKMEENNEKLVKDRQKLEYDRKEMMEIIERKNQEWEKEAKELIAAKTELKNEQEEFEAKMKNDEDNLAKKREDLKKEAMLLYEKAKVVYAKAMSMEEEESGNEKTKLVSLEEEKNCMPTKIKRLDEPFDQIGFERSNYEENGLWKPLETEWDNQQISN